MRNIVVTAQPAWKPMLVLTIALIAAVITPLSSHAQVAQWNQVVTDPKLQKAMLRAVREVAIDYINRLDEDGIAGAIAFIDTQLDYPLQLSSSNFRHLNLNALQAKAAYVIRYQAKSSAGVNVRVEIPDNLNVGAVSSAFAPIGSGAGGGEIPGDGAMMVCPINKAGLEFMSGVISIASIDKDGALRADQDGKDIIQIHNDILRLTYKYYGHTPEDH
ncbi:MAG: hypothetical protein AAF699_13410 [Pseudomonadota bacterium]